jgi:nucleotide-binding universal stress UspA family protein
MIRSILLPLAEGPLAANARDFALWLANKEGSRIHVLAVIDLKAFEIPVLGTPDGFMPSVVTPPLQESQSLLEEMTAAAKERLEAFAQECAAREISCSTDIRTGIPAEVMAKTAIAHDIVVMSRSGYSRISDAPSRMDVVVPQVVRSSIRPVLVAGSKPREGKDVQNILVAFDGSMHAGRALLVAAELGARPGVQCTLVAIGSKPSELICGIVTSTRTDILIMGAYGHSPVREMLFGSTTERVLSHCGTTVILQS